jgi:hypothetical protein
MSLPKLRRGIARIDDLRARSVVDLTTGCWHWQGAKGTDGTPRMWVYDPDYGDKRTVSGPRGVFLIAHNRAPRGLAYRCCGSSGCVNWMHVYEAFSRVVIGMHTQRAGRWKGTHLEQRRANLQRARAARGIVATPDTHVLTIRAAGGEVTNRALANALGMRESTVSSIRLGKSRAGVGVA